jgi:FAD synthetase
MIRDSIVMATVLVIGTFDGLHPGHEDYFRQAKALGDQVIALVSRDQTVMSVKGQLPRVNEEQRRKNVESHPFVDSAVLGDADDKLKVVCDVDPDVILLGYDQRAFTENLDEELLKRGLHCRVVRAEPFRPEVYKSSLKFGSYPSEEPEASIESELVPDWLPL